ncbi:MAG: DUF1302 domain-containing protein [bacterium]|nr:DUF1302 domain-containing protein [bacterium]
MQSEQSPKQQPLEDPDVGEVEGILAGFDDLGGEDQIPKKSALESAVRFGGRFTLGTTYSFAHERPVPGATDWRGLSRFRLLTELEAEAQLAESWKLFASGHTFYDFAYSIQGRHGFTSEVLDQHERELELNDTYIAGRLGRQLHLKVGRQVVAWGTSETIRVTDILNPLDLREPGLTDIENLRLPVTMTRLDWLTGPWIVSAMALHEIRFDKNPAFGHEFYPYEIPLLEATVPESSLENTEFAVSLRGSFRGWDIALYWADVFDDEPHAKPVGPWQIALEHSRIQMFGAAADLAAGDWLFKAELGHFSGLEFFYSPGETTSRTDVLAGVEYSGWTDTSLTFEAAVRHLHDTDPRFELPPDFAIQDRFEWVVRLSRFLMHQTLTLNLVAITYEADGSGGALQRLEARYDITDRLEVVGGVVLYQSGSTPGLQNIGDNDRLFVDVSYRF